jgi:predicted ATP-dependent serine protease
LCIRVLLFVASAYDIATYTIKSAWDSLNSESDLGGIPTCPSFDSLFGGQGIALGQLTEICGVAGIGKTQFGYPTTLINNIATILKT